MKEWNAILLTGLDRFYFSKLVPAGLVEPVDGGFMLSSQPAKRGLVKKFLYESYGMARETILKAQEAKIKEEHRRRVRRRELDRQALEMLPDGIVCVDRAGSLYYMNPAAERMLCENQTLKENLFGEGALEKSLRTYSKDRVMARLNAKVRENLENIQLFGNRAVVKNGVKRYDVALGRQVILIRDTTDQHLIDQEIGRLYRHELKAALDVMEVGLETSKQLFHSGNTQEALEFLEQVQNKRSELCTMLEERIDFIRLHSDVFTIRPQQVNLNLVVDKCVSNNKESALKKGVRIVSNHMDIQPIHVLGEERFLKRALDNVVRNAVKFSHPDTQITITLHKSASEATIQVADEGPGVAPEHLSEIFQLGFTTGGSGRGLYIAKRIAEAHGGRIEASSTLGRGAVFTLHLPTGQV
jgi:signal transduction histidine kinase